MAHADGIGMTCLGKCTLTSVVQPTINVNGYVTHTFNYSGVCGFVIDMPLNFDVAILDVSLNGATYTVTSYCGKLNSDNGFGFQSQFAVDIWAVAEITDSNTPTTSFGLCLYNAYGIRTFDFNSPGISFISVVGNYIGGGVDIPALVRPVVMGVCEGYDVSYWEYPGQTPEWHKVDSSAAVRRSSSTRISTDFIQTYRSSGPMSGGTNISEEPSGPFVIFEGAGFP